jgi:hypothetical protein
MREEILKELDKFTQEAKPTWVIKYNNKHVSVGKKSGWITITAAKNALRHWLPNFDNWRKRLEIIQELEEQGIITYERVI